MEILELIKNYYLKENNTTGGNLHVVLDDGNMEDYFVKSCIKRAEKDNDIDGIKIGKELLKLSLEEREEIYNQI